MKNQIEAIICKTRSDLLDACGDISKVLVSDISLGTWRPHAIAQDFLAQLEVGSVTVGPVAESGDNPGVYSDLIGQLIDMETAGDLQVTTAYNHARLVADRIERLSLYVVVVIAPYDRAAWEPSALAFIKFLAEAVINARVLIVAADRDSIPEHLNVVWHGQKEAIDNTSHEQLPFTLFNVIPGIIDESIFKYLSKETRPSYLIELGGGRYLVPPSARNRIEDAPTEIYDAIVSQFPHDDWISAFALSRGTHAQGVTHRLYSFASRAFGDGDWDFGLKLLGDAVRYADNELQRWIVEAQLQGMRIAMARFREAGAASLPPPKVSAILRGFLFQSKAWALVMTGNPTDAEGLFKEALVLLESQSQSRTYLYLLNIYALTCLRLDRSAEALAIERRIEKQLSGLDEIDFHLTYINALNTARLLRRLGDLDGARSYYERAFDTSIGVRSESDFVFQNACLGFLEDKNGCSEQACIAWIRTACHWLAMEIPESLAPRVVRLIVGDVPYDFVARVSDAIQERLLTSAERAIGSRILTDKPGQRVRLVYSDKLLPGMARGGSAMGSDGWGLIVGTYDGEARALHKSRARLGGKLLDILRALVSVDLRWQEDCILIVDHQNGKEMPRTLAELLNAVRDSPSKVYWKDSEIDLCESDRVQLTDEARLRVGSAVKSLSLTDSPHVRFKRYLKPRMLSVEEVHLLAIGKSRSVGELRQIDFGYDFRPILERLVSDRVIELVTA